MTRIRYIRDGELLRTRYYNKTTSFIIAYINTKYNIYSVETQDGIIAEGSAKNIRACKSNIRKIFRSLGIIKTDEVRK